MRLKAIMLLLIAGGMSASCTSEYEECLEQGRSLQKKLSYVQKSQVDNSNEILLVEITEIQKEINFLAKVSGHEELFLREILNTRD